MSREMRTASLLTDGGGTIATRVEVYVCDSCHEFSPEGTFWLSVSRVGCMTSYSDPLAVERHFCSLEHAAEWSGRFE